MRNLIIKLNEDKNNGNESLFKKRFIEHYINICNMCFPKDFKFSQKIYHYINNDYNLNLGICKCGNRCKFKNYKKGYYKHCSNKCSQQDKNTVEKRKNTNLLKYGYDNPAKNEEIKAKQIKTNNIKYGFNSPSCVNSINELQRKSSYITKEKRNTFNTSSVEELFSNYLTSNNIKFKRQYVSNLYPYHCDFYIYKYDLYIEIQGNWTHGGDTFLHTKPHPYDKDNEQDIKQYKYWEEKSKESKYYKNALYNWTIRDVEKRNIAKNNNLNLLEIFSYDINEVINYFKKHIEII